jgi:ureidoglycolate lyase
MKDETRIMLKPVPLTPERFAPYGDVIAATPDARKSMNEARFERFHELAQVDVGADEGGRVGVSIARCRTPTSLPHHFDMIERHPLGSQAFVPLAPFPFVVVVAPPAETAEAADLQAFVTNGRQGVNYRKGTWHMPLIGLEEGQEFLVIDRAADGANCDELVLSERVTLLAP